jgi:Flp pilus assembly pilin Flp
MQMLELYTKLQARIAREEGQTMAEYAVVLAVITIGIFVALGILSGAISGALSTVSSNL